MKRKFPEVDGKSRTCDLDMSVLEFREAGHRLIEQLAEYYESLPNRNLTPAKSQLQIRELLGNGSLPDHGIAAGDLLHEVAPLIFDNSLHNGHPRFLGYISASAAPLGALADLLAAAVNSNVAKWELSPIASEIETQTVQWIAELIGYPRDCGGIMVSGGNSANFHAFVAARRATAQWDIRKEGLYGEAQKLTAYVSRETHTWIDKAADVCGLGSAAVRWIETDDQQRMDMNALRSQVKIDRRNGCLPFLVVGTAGTVSTGAIDPIRELAEFCETQGIWLHVDGAYGAPAACLPESPDDLHSLAFANSVAIDPHKWLHSPIAAACVMTRDPNALRNAFDFRPDYYHFDDESSNGIDYYQHGMQNSRGFRALKVWLGLRQAGRAGYQATIRDDIRLARYLFQSVKSHTEFEVRTLGLSIVTFRYVPADLAGNDDSVAKYLNQLNKALLAEVQKSGQAFVSNAIVDGDYLLRACVINFRTTEPDIDSVLQIISGTARSLDERMRAEYLAA